MFMGDDTWESLFPQTFHVSVPFDSFNTKDIDTVDDGIEGLLFDYLPGHTRQKNQGQKSNSKSSVSNSGNNSKHNNSKHNNNVSNNITADWSLLVAHFLGVDHIGHSYSATHPLMAQRLTRMDDVLHQVIEALANDREKGDTILFMFGDHGMTDR